MYEKLEDHPHLVTHYGVAFSSEHKKVNIFMELCGMFFSCSSRVCLTLRSADGDGRKNIA